MVLARGHPAMHPHVAHAPTLNPCTNFKFSPTENEPQHHGGTSRTPCHHPISQPQHHNAAMESRQRRVQKVAWSEGISMVFFFFCWRRCGGEKTGLKNLKLAVKMVKSKKLIYVTTGSVQKVFLHVRKGGLDSGRVVSR